MPSEKYASICHVCHYPGSPPTGERAMHDNTDTTGIVEWAPFRLKAGVADAALLEASQALQQDFLARQPGFVKRELLRGTDGQWVDLVFWRDEASANAIMALIAASDSCQTYFHLM